MKGKVLIFIIGLLVGAIITTGVFLILQKNNILTNTNQGQFQGEPGGQMMNSNSVPPTPPPNMDGNSMMGEPPAKPDGDNRQMPPEMQTQTTDTTTQSSN